MFFCCLFFNNYHFNGGSLMKNKGNKGLLISVLVVVVLVVMYFFVSVSYKNQEVRLRNRISVQQKTNEVVYDTVWKIISQQAQVSENYKDSFKEIYGDIMEGRYGNENGGTLMKFITESNPQFDIRLYEKVSNSIEIQRTEFLREQKKLIDLKAAHDSLRKTEPASWFVGNVPEIEIQVVTSSKTTKTFETGREDDVKVF